MIQRIQSIYLLVAAILLSYLVSGPLCEFITTDGKTIYLFNNGFRFAETEQMIIYTLPLAILLWITLLLSVINIFLFKNRRLQIRACVYNIILLLGFSGLIYFYYKVGIKEVVSKSDLEISSYRMFYAVLLPLFSAFFTYLAQKRILKDDALVKSMDRLR